MTRCLVTGGKGFIGSHLVNYLKNKGHWVRSVDIKSGCSLSTKEDEFILLDLRGQGSCLRATLNIDWVFHLAANMGGIGYTSTHDAIIMRDNTLIDVNMLDASKWQDVRRFFFSSSACIYPTQLQTKPDSPPLKESDAYPANPDMAYGWEKLYMELLLKHYQQDYGLPVRIARFHNIYGPHGAWRGERDKVPAATCRKVAEAKLYGRDMIEVWGDGLQTRSFLHVDDCVEGFYKLMESDYSKPLNIGTDESISINNLARMVMEIAGVDLGIDHDLTMPQGVRGRNADLTLVKEVLDWQPKISLKEGMAELYKWVSNQVATIK